MSIWNRWCEKVKAHNIKLEEMNCLEERWTPMEIFAPIFVGLAFFVGTIAIALMVGKIPNIGFMAISSSIVTVLFATGLALNWHLYS